MSRVPHDLTSWQLQVNQEGVGNNTLADIKRTSGSKIPHQAFLQLRAVWLPDKLAKETINTLRKTDLIQDSMSTTRDIIDRKPDDLNKFHNFLRAIGGVRASHPATPLSQNAEYYRNPDAAEAKLGSFVPLLSQWKQLKPAAPSREPAGPPPPCSSPLHDPMDEIMQPIFAEAPRHRSGSGELASQADLIAFFDQFHLETPSKPPRVHGKPSAAEEPNADSANVSPVLSPRESLASGFGDEDEVDAEMPGRFGPPSSDLFEKRRTKYEVQTSIFFSTFFHAFFAYHLSISWTQFLRVITEEASYRFGGGDTPDAPVIFVARTDGAFYVIGDDGVQTKVFMPFELKRHSRDEKRDATCREETAEMTAIVYEEFVRGKQQ